MIPPINDNIWTQIKLIWKELERLAKRQFDVINGVVNIGDEGNIKFDPVNNEINIKNKIKLKTNGTDQHEINIDGKIRLRVDGINVYATFGSSDEIVLDAVNKKINVGSKVVLDASGGVGEIFVYDNSGNPSIYMKGGTT